MRIHRIAGLGMAGLLLVLSSPLLWSAAPTPYPGATLHKEHEEYWVEGLRAPLIYRIEYSRDAFDKVIDFYRPLLKLTRRGVTEAWFDDPAAGKAGYEAVMLRRHDGILSENDLFRPFQDELAAIQVGMLPAGHTRSELEALKRQYAYLARDAFFPDFSPQQHLKSCQTRLQADVSDANTAWQDYGRRMEQLARQGRFAELQQSVDQGIAIANGMRSIHAVSHWDEWVECLKELDRHAFRTEIWLRQR